MTKPEGYPVPPGIIAVTSYGSVALETVRCLTEMRGALDKQGLHNVTWQYVPGTLVDKARNDAVEAMLRTPAQWLLFLDADMVFAPHIAAQLIETAFAQQSQQLKVAPWADIIGAWCPLRGSPYLPTIDTGTGTWEPHEPNQGVVEVIRTGSACILIKRHVFEKMARPWYGVRNAPRPLDVMAELDNFARTKFDGRNPFAERAEWAQLLGCARDENLRAPQGGAVGEDSNFCDRAKALGFRIAVQTHAVASHVDRMIITPQQHREAIQAARKRWRHLVGVEE